MVLGASNLAVDHEWYREFSSGCYKYVGGRENVSPHCDMASYFVLISCTKNLTNCDMNSSGAEPSLFFVSDLK